MIRSAFILIPQKGCFYVCCSHAWQLLAFHSQSSVYFTQHTVCMIHPCDKSFILCYCWVEVKQSIRRDFIQISGPQPFWQQGQVSWKTIFPQTRVGGWFQDDSSSLQLLCTLFLLLSHQLHFRSLGIRPRSLGTSGLGGGHEQARSC